ncbi:MAG: WYL domain-containing protein [Burkholderiales bacterium]|nr:WYL domain-containing protein [Burkholderiales bacterium]
METRRILKMLELIPPAPRKATAAEIADGLDRAGFRVNKRSVERDLNELSRALPLVRSDRNRPYGWSFRQGSAVSLPGLTTPQAVVFQLVEQHLRPLMPPSAIRELEPFFEQARRRLRSAEHSRVARWPDKIRQVPTSQPLLPPNIRREVHEAVCDALLEECQLEIVYRKRGGLGDQTWRIHPLALVQRGSVIYLVAGFYAFPDARTLALHRVQRAKKLPDRAAVPRDFDIDRFIESGEFGFGGKQKIRLEAIFHDGAGEHLEETPLTADQELTRIDDTTHRLVADVLWTRQLEWWLRGFGDSVEIVAPKACRTAMRHRSTIAGTRYVRSGQAGRLP